ncbi:MAG: DUF4956 domain-containing protein [Elusimicrobia bacterium]|nr:DUF4956 domain-containing protein [Elusimicrobiota bacterium]
MISMIKDLFKSNYTAAAVSTNLLLSVILGFIVVFVYKLNNRRNSNVASFNVVLLLVSVIVCAIIMELGTNIALSLGLIGSLSIIRFRTAIKNPMDVTYIFWAICVGLGCGSNSYKIAIISTVFIAVILIFMVKFNLFNLISDEYLIIISYSADQLKFNELKNLLLKNKCHMRSVESNIEENIYECIFGLKAYRKQNLEKITAELDRLKGIKNYKIFSSENEVVV